MSDTRADQKPTRRELIKAALAVGTYAAPLILSTSVPATLSAQVSGRTVGATLAGVVTDGISGVPIGGVFIIVGDVQAVTDASGAYSMPNPPTGLQMVTVMADGYVTRTYSVAIAESGTTVFSPTVTINAQP